MWKTKKRLLTLIITFGLTVTSVVPGTEHARAVEAGMYDDLYIEALTEEKDAAVYKTDTVRKGTFSIYFTSILPHIDYDDYFYLWNNLPIGEVTFLNYEAKVGDWLEVGDPVCNIEIKVDEERIAELESQIAKEEDMLTTYAYTCEELLAEYDRLYQSGNGDAELAKLLYDRLKHSYDEEVKRRRESIDALQAEYDGWRMAQLQTSINATACGNVAYLEDFHRGRVIENYGFVGVMIRSEDTRISIDSGSDYLRYGLPAMIVQNDRDKKIECIGKVCTSLDTSLPAGLVGTRNLINFDDDAYKTLNPNKGMTLKVERVHMENALMVKKKAVYDDSHGSYVLMDKDGRKTRKYVVVGGSNDDDTWIISGVNEGDAVILK
ncbi:MAG: hypothetical protein K6F44_07615 [Lachnospiraceae bacterium]|nr:hypothetical protein [Lachnospiraceae bacterium]